MYCVKCLVLILLNGINNINGMPLSILSNVLRKQMESYMHAFAFFCMYVYVVLKEI